MKYIASFDLPQYDYEQRSINLAAVNVMEYMAGLYNNMAPLEIISPIRTLARKGFFKSRKLNLMNGISLRIPFSFGVNSTIGRIISILIVQFWLLKVLLFNCKRGETIIVYHSAALMRIIKFANRIKKFNLIFEIREIYSDINCIVDSKTEYEYFDIADKYIFATSQLNKKINHNNKPYVIAPGIYQNLTSEGIDKFDDGKIHLVYAGNFRKAKGGAESSIRIAEFLNDEYVIHILGSGDKASLNEILKLIDAQNSKHGAKIIYEGIKRGVDFNKFLQKCDIGLSTQNPEGTFNESSFPSKVLTYLCCGLEALSAEIPAVTDSPIGSYVHYYQKHDSSAIAKSIMRIKTHKNCVGSMDKLHCALIRDIELLLNNDK